MQVPPITVSLQLHDCSTQALREEGRVEKSSRTGLVDRKTNGGRFCGAGGDYKTDQAQAFTYDCRSRAIYKGFW
jgi:hypothetical protein